jgi:hypothetical protein
MNCFGIIYVILMAHLDKGKKGDIEVISFDSLKNDLKESSEPSPKHMKKYIDSE